MKWLQIHITVDQEQVEFTETLLMSLGAVSVTLDDAEDQALLNHYQVKHHSGTKSLLLVFTNKTNKTQLMLIL